jgi:Flp pilus assembly protein TadG
MYQRQSNRASRRSSARMRRNSNRRGVAAVEFAIVAPVFFLVIIGIIEIGRAMMVQQVLVNASRVGARRAVTLSSTESAVIAAATEYAAGVGVNGIEVTVSPDPATAEAGAAVTVDVDIDYAEVSWLPAPWFMGGKNLAASSVMRKEGF